MKKRRALTHTAVSTDIHALLSHCSLSGALGNMKHAQRLCFVHIPRICLNRNIERALNDKQRDCTDRNDPGVVRDEITGCDVTSLVFITPDVQGELHRALWAELITCAILEHMDQDLYAKPLPARNQKCFPSDQTPTTIKISTPILLDSL